MAGTFVADRGSGSVDSTFSLTWSVVTVGAVSAGNKAILAIRSGSRNQVSSVSGGGVTWTVDGRGDNAGANGGSVTVISADCPAGLPNGTTITIVDVAGGDQFDKRRWGLSEFAGLATGPPLSNEVANAFGTSTACNAGNIAGSSNTGDIGFAAVSFPANSVAADHTPTNAATKIHTVSSASGSLWDNYRILGSVANPNGGESTSLGAANWAAVFLVYSQAVVVTPGYSGVHSPAIPHVVTEIAFASQPADLNPVWTTVSPYVKEIHSKYGRSNPLEDIDAGSCSYILDNRDRRFEPLYASSPYSPNIKPLKRIRSYALENPLTHPDFEDPAAIASWSRYQGDGALSRPAYGLAPAAKFGDWKCQVDIGTVVGTWSGIQQTGAVFQAMPVTGEYVGISVYCYASKAGFVQLTLMNQAGTTIAQTTFTLVANQWNRITTTGAVPAGTTSFTFIAQPVVGGAAWAAHDLVYFDGAQIHHFHTANSNFIPQTPAAFDQAAPFTKTIYIFDGFIEGWPQEWAGGMQADVMVTAVDGFKPLAPMQVIRGDYNLVVMDDLPTWYFRLGEQLTTQAAQNEVASGIQDGVYTVAGGSPILGQPSAIVGDYDGAAKFTTTGGAGGTSDMRKTVVKIPTRQFALEMLMKFDNAVPGASPDNSGDQYTMWSHGDNTGGYGSIIVLGWNYFTAAGAPALPYTGMYLYIEFYYGNNWNINRYYIPNPAGTAAYWTSWHLISLYWDGLGQDGNAGWPQVWLDGVRVDISQGANLTFSQNCNTRAGNSAKISRPYLGKLTQAGISRTMFLGNDYTDIFGVRGCTIDEFAYWVDLIPASGFAARHFAALSYGAPSEDSGTRMGHLLDQASLPVSGLNPWPAARRQIDTGVSQVIGMRWSEDKLVDLIKQCTKSEAGTFYFHPNGKATFYNRWHTIQYPYSTPKATLSDQPVPANQLPPFEDVGTGGVDFDDSDIYNDVTISRFSAGYGDASGAQSVIDTTSQADYLVRSLTLDDTIVTTDAEALNAANWFLWMFKNPGLKAKSVEIEPLDDPTNLWRLLSLAFISDRLSLVRHPPPGTGTPLTFEVLIQGVQYDIAAGTWDVTYTVYPGPSRDFWQLPDSATNDEYAQYSVLGTTTRLAY